MRRLGFWSCAMLWLISSCSCAGPNTSPTVPLSTSKASAERPRVRLPEGDVVGVRQGALAVYKGIPYAEAPIGDMRFQPPVPSGPWQHPLDASRFGASCPQDLSGIGWALGEEANVFSEDCLSVNVWGPAQADGEKSDDDKKPVMVFIYGGGFIVGSSSWPR